VLIALLLALTLEDPATPADPVAASATTAHTTVAEPPRGALLVLPESVPNQPLEALRFVWRQHPSLRAGRNLRLDFAAKLQEDARDPGDDPTGFNTWQLHRARAGVDGEVFRKIQFSIEREFSENLINDPTKKSTKSQWKDVYVEANLANAIQIRAGKFKVPYGLDQTSNESNLDFVFRSLGGDYLSPGRDIGGMVHGRFFKRGLNYWAGGFKHDGENSRSGNPRPELRKIRGADTTFAGRVTAAVFRKARLGFLHDAEVGGSFASSQLSDNGFTPNGLRGRTVMSQYTFFEGVFVKGTRSRYGAEFDVTHGRFGGRAEYMLATDTRHDQGIGDQDLSNVRGKAWYVLGTWVLTGERKDRPVEARKGGVGRGGYGALELTARFDTLRFDSKEGQDTPFANPRAETILPNGDKVFTGGFTYYANGWSKIQGNAIHETIEDLRRSPTPAGASTPTSKSWSLVLRLQLAL